MINRKWWLWLIFPQFPTQSRLLQGTTSRVLHKWTAPRLPDPPCCLSTSRLGFRGLKPKLLATPWRYRRCKIQEFLKIWYGNLELLEPRIMTFIIYIYILDYWCAWILLGKPPFHPLITLILEGIQDLMCRHAQKPEGSPAKTEIFIRNPCEFKKIKHEHCSD